MESLPILLGFHDLPEIPAEVEALCADTDPVSNREGAIEALRRSFIFAREAVAAVPDERLGDATKLTEPSLRALLKLADCIIPEDSDPSATQAGFTEFLERNWQDLGEDAHSLLERGLRALEAESAQRHGGRGFAVPAA